MKYANLSGCDKSVSRIIFGCASKMMFNGENCDEIFDAALAAGINAFDTARGYGKSERVLGGWIKRRNIRDKVTVISKGALHGLLGNNRVNEKCIRSDLQKSISALDGVGIDIYFLHRDDPKTDAGVYVELLNEFKQKGYIKAFGVSNWTYKRIIEANEYAEKHGLEPITASEPHYSLATAGRWTWIGCTSVTGAKHADEREWYINTGLPLFAFSPLGGGYLSGRVKSDDLKRTVKNLSHAMRVTFASEENAQRLRRCEALALETGCTVAQIALAYVLCSGMNAFAITGSTNPERIRQSAAAADINLTPERIRYLENGLPFSDKGKQDLQ